MTIRRTTCFGTCPSYRVEIHGDGTALYDGQAYVAVTGSHRGSVSKETVSELVDAFRNVDYYSLEDEYPVLHLTCITHRKNPIYATTIVGKPPMEDAWMGKAVERIFLPLMKLTLPEIVDVNLPVEAVFHNLMIVSIRKSYPGHARKVMSGIWAMGQAMFTKCIIVVDEDVDVQDTAEVVLRVANHIDPERDIQFTLGPVDSLDHASRLPNFGSKMGIDATRKWSTEGFARPWPDEIRMSDDVKAAVDEKWKSLGID